MQRVTTAEAAAAAARAHSVWLVHAASCVQCANERHKRPAVRVFCAAGAGLYAAILETEGALERARQADRGHLPGQLPLRPTGLG